MILALRPALVFMENVPGILTANDGKDFAWLERAMDRLGYDVRHALYAASDLGAPHVRRRWYALCFRRGGATARVPPGRQLLRPFDWSASKEPRAHLVGEPGPDHKHRLRALGNAVVPDCARLAFLELLRGERLGAAIPRAPRRREIVLRPTIVSASPRARKNKKVSSPLVRGDLVVAHFPTPRAGNTGHCNVLTERCARDLGTAVRFWTGARGPRATGVINPQFVEYLMGFPRDWTKVSLDSRRR